VATFQRVFGQAYLFRNHLKTQSVPVALVGFKQAGLDWVAVARRCEQERRAGHLRDPVCRHTQGLALLYLGIALREPQAAGPLNTLRNLRVELGAAQHLMSGNPGDYFHGAADRWLALLQRQLKALEADTALPESLRPFPAIGLLSSRWEIAAENNDPTAAALQPELAAQIPHIIRTDTGADWSLWPGRNPTSAQPAPGTEASR
jgi:hypothetical protein